MLSFDYDDDDECAQIFCYALALSNFEEVISVYVSHTLRSRSVELNWQRICPVPRQWLWIATRQVEVPNHHQSLFHASITRTLCYASEAQTLRKQNPAKSKNPAFDSANMAHETPLCSPNPLVHNFLNLFGYSMASCVLRRRLVFGIDLESLCLDISAHRDSNNLIIAANSLSLGQR